MLDRFGMRRKDASAAIVAAHCASVDSAADLRRRTAMDRDGRMGSGIPGGEILGASSRRGALTMAPCRRRRMTAQPLLLAVIACMAGTQTVRAERHVEPFEPTSMRDWRKVGMDGTGCYWSSTTGGPVLFAANGRTAVVRVAGRIVRLEPARTAKNLFPFTYDTWQASGMRIRVVDTAIVKAMGDETVTTDAFLVVDRNGRPRRFKGSMICGS